MEGQVARLATMTQWDVELAPPWRRGRRSEGPARNGGLRDALGCSGRPHLRQTPLSSVLVQPVHFITNFHDHVALPGDTQAVFDPLYHLGVSLGLRAKLRLHDVRPELRPGQHLDSLPAPLAAVHGLDFHGDVHDDLRQTVGSEMLQTRFGVNPIPGRVEGPQEGLLAPPGLQELPVSVVGAHHTIPSETAQPPARVL